MFTLVTGFKSCTSCYPVKYISSGELLQNDEIQLLQKIG